jgi:hypothetical protein
MAPVVTRYRADRAIGKGTITAIGHSPETDAIRVCFVA